MGIPARPPEDDDDEETTRLSGHDLTRCVAVRGRTCRLLVSAARINGERKLEPWRFRTALRDPRGVEYQFPPEHRSEGNSSCTALLDSTKRHPYSSSIYLPPDSL
ncbi:unnamed protein product [Mesocestoides corti]|uniref:Uncharacterized protein n=1 Tax=Mesocestoides corti TaxID=53468 RepID=A0A0R3U253_MESCO|nr:unnamed protein product [Mesocestoides corti]